MKMEVNDKIKTVSVNIGGNAPRIKFDTMLDLAIGDKVIVETANGSEWGVVATSPVPNKKKANNLILRKADAQDERAIKDLLNAADNAMKVAEEKIAKYKLDMKLLSANYTMDGSKVLIHFYSENRVDFRELVKELAYALKARIELRQVGARDEVKMIGAMGPCGMQCCCARFRGGFESVTIKMAKNQNISLNPQKINGMCGRLLCCLAYENDHYTKTWEKMPRLGSEVTTPDGKGIATDCHALKETVNVKFKNGEIANFKTYKLCDVKCKQCGRRDDQK
jgi:cell fate regulator YaaT (PSP1 superfamily)